MFVIAASMSVLFAACTTVEDSKELPTQTVTQSKETQKENQEKTEKETKENITERLEQMSDYSGTADAYNETFYEETMTKMDGFFEEGTVTDQNEGVVDQIIE